jgi:microcompartment protein CcmL/EutN
VRHPQSIGVVETLTAPSIIWAADAAIKATDIDIVEVRIARALGGKNICVINGVLSDVKESVRTGIAYPEEKGFLVDYQVIAAPHPDLYRAVM